MWSLGFLLMQEPFLISDTVDARAHTHTQKSISTPAIAVVVCRPMM